jgi:hypothetical protein
MLSDHLPTLNGREPKRLSLLELTQSISSFIQPFVDFIYVAFGKTTGLSKSGAVGTRILNIYWAGEIDPGQQTSRNRKNQGISRD